MIAKYYGSEPTGGWDGPDHLAKPTGYTLEQIKSWCNDPDPCFEVSEEEIKAVGCDLVDALETAERDKQLLEARLAKAVEALNSAKYHMHNGNLGSCENAIMHALAEIAPPEPTTGGK